MTPTSAEPSFEASIYDAVRDAVIVRDPAGRILSWNRSAETLYGWTAQEAIGQLADALLESDPTPPAEETVWDGELTRRTASGRPVVVDVRITRGADGNSRSPVFVESGRDITEERGVRRALERSEYRYRNLFHAMAASFWEIDISGATPIVAEIWASGVTDLEGYLLARPDKVRDLMKAARVVDVNDHSIDQFGDGDRDRLMTDVEVFWPEESYAQYVHMLVAHRSGQGQHTAEARLRTVSGKPVDVAFTACLGPELLTEGRIIFAAVDLTRLNQSRTELARSRERFRNLFQNMPIALCQLDASQMAPKYRSWLGSLTVSPEHFFEEFPERLEEVMDTLVIDEANTLAIRLLGADSADQLIGLPVRSFWAKRRDTFQRVVTARLMGQPSYQEETQMVTLDGRIIDIVFACSFQQGEDGRDISMIGMADIGDRVKAQQMLSQLQADFAHAARISMLGELTASLAHEVSQPLTAIAANADAGLRWLERPEPDVAEALDLTRRIAGDARRASGIISRIRAMAGRRPPEPEAVDLNALVEGTARFLESQAQSSGVIVSLRLDPDLPTILGDRTQLEQVVANLAINAMQALVQAGKDHRAVTITTRDRGETGVDCIVEDNGPGIADQDLEQLFDSFFTTKPTGMGLGLPICRSIIQSHGGQLRAENRPHRRGARFTFSLPAALQA